MSKQKKKKSHQKYLNTDILVFTMKEGRGKDVMCATFQRNNFSRKTYRIFLRNIQLYSHKTSSLSEIKEEFLDGNMVIKHQSICYSISPNSPFYNEYIEYCEKLYNTQILFIETIKKAVHLSVYGLFLILF
jgi:hypothetical protein